MISFTHFGKSSESDLILSIIHNALDGYEVHKGLYDFFTWFDIYMKPLDEATWADVLGLFVFSSALLLCQKNV